MQRKADNTEVIGKLLQNILFKILIIFFKFLNLIIITALNDKKTSKRSTEKLGKYISLI